MSSIGVMKVIIINRFSRGGGWMGMGPWELVEGLAYVQPFLNPCSPSALPKEWANGWETE